MTTWTDPASTQTSWAITPSRDEVFSFTVGSPIGLLLTITQSSTQTITIDGDTQWSSSSSIQTAWST